MPERRSECGRASSEQESGGPLGPATQQAASNNPYMDVCLWHHRRRNFFLSLSYSVLRACLFCLILYLSLKKCVQSDSLFLF